MTDEQTAHADRTKVGTASRTIREAFRAGYWTYCGPANDAELQQALKDEEHAWLEWTRTK